MSILIHWCNIIIIEVTDFPYASSLALGLTQPPIQMVLGLFQS